MVSITNYMGASVDNIDSKIQKKNLPNIACQLSIVITFPYICTMISVDQVDFVHTNPVVLAAKNSFIRYFVNHLNTVITDIR